MKMNITSADYAEILGSFEIPEFGMTPDTTTELNPFESPWFQGHLQSTYNEEFHIIQHDILPHRCLKVDANLDTPCITFCMGLEGHLRYHYDFMKHEQIWNPGTANIWLNFPDSHGYSFFEKSKRHSSLDLMISPRLFERMAGLYPEIFETLRESYLKGKTCSLFPINKPFTPQLLLIIEALQHTKIFGTAEAMYRDAKIMELTSHFLNLPDNQHKRSAIAPKDFDNLHHARQILLENHLHPPSLFELAHLAGINEFKLKKGFKELFGNTVFGELLQHRMKMASQLLRDTNQSMAEIAQLCGFSSSSHFCTVFKKHKGTTPLIFRKTQS